MSTRSAAGSGRTASVLASAAVAVLASACVLGGPSASPSAGASAGTSSVASPAASAGSSTTAAPSVQASAAASAGPLAPGTYARVIVDGLRIRVAAKADATPVGALFFDDVIRVRGDAGLIGGYHWYEVVTFHTANDQQLNGYVAGEKDGTAYLEALPGEPSPTPTRSATPSAAASAAASAS